MRIAFAFFAFLLFSACGLAHAQTQPDLRESLTRFDAALAAGDAQGAAQIASEIAALDFSATPLEPREARALRTSLADALAEGGNVEEAIALLEQIVAEDRAELAQAHDTVTSSELRADLTARLEKLGELHTRQFRAAAVAASLKDADERERLAALSRMRDAGSRRDAAYRSALTEARNLLGVDQPQTRFVLAEVLRDVVVPASASTETTPIQREFTRLRALETAAQVEPLASLGGSGADQPYETVRVFFGASRDATASLDPERTFGGARANLTYGSLLVTVPSARALGAVPRPGWFDFEGAQDGVHIVLRRVDRDASADAFRDRLTRSVADPTRGQHDAFVYIHGYNESFANAARRTAQLAVDLDMRNGAVLYSWPSGDLLSYQVAQNNVEPSVDALVNLLRTVTNSGAERVHLFAHSMGNRVLLGALDVLRQSGVSARPAFGQIIFASPDIDADVFVDRVSNVRRLAQGMTLYASNNDRALQLSRWLGGGYLRAGEVPIASSIGRSVVAVDTSPIRRPPGDLFAHSDYVGGAINDLRAVVWLSLAPQSRCLLASRGNHWEASDARRGCEDLAFRRAISAVRLYGSEAPSQIEQFIQQLEVSGDRVDLASWRTALGIVRGLGR